MVDNSSQSFGSLGLRPKFVGTFIFTPLVVASLILVGGELRARRAWGDRTVAQGHAIADAVDATAGYYGLFGLTDDLKKIIGDLKVRNPSIDCVPCGTAEGNPLAASGRRPAGIDKVTARETAIDRATGREHLFVRSFSEGDKIKGYFRMLINESQARAAGNKLILSGIFVTLMALLVAALLALLASRIIVRPVVRLAESAQGIAGGDLTQRAAMGSGDEIGQLAETFNGMAANLEKTLTKLVRSQTQLKGAAEAVGSRSRTVIERVDEQRTIIDET